MTHFVGHTLKLLEVGELHADDRLSCLAVLLPKRIGAGVFRDVFEIAGRRDVVLKVERRGMEFCNILEWKVWQEAEGTPAAQWLAPCENISHDGRALLQKRTKPMPDKTWNALKVPAWFTDLKQENWGLYQGRPVCHDYALNLIMSRGMRGAALQPAVPAWAKGEG